MSIKKLLCLCHIISHFKMQKVICRLCCLHNICYNENTKRFNLGHQIMVYLFFLLEILNKMTIVHCEIQVAMGELLCTSVRRAFFWAWLIILELIAVIHWHYERPRFWFMFGCIMCWHLQMLLHVNSFIWLQCIYVAMRRVFTAPIDNRQRLRILKKLLKVQPKLNEILQHIGKFFCVNIIVICALISNSFFHTFVATDMIIALEPNGNIYCIEPYQLRYLCNLLILTLTLLLVVRDFKAERDKFYQRLWHTNKFCQKILVYKSFQRYLPRRKQQLDILDVMKEHNPDKYNGLKSFYKQCRHRAACSMQQAER
ncbi:uncharacterized protein Grl62c [Drosophila tropicalis]|uniref:uncharacterized protein Grl62c n=1 Tax=Drosophila tropicalis TaxID=46794 RepID=UPI0035ABBBBF